MKISIFTSFEQIYLITLGLSVYIAGSALTVLFRFPLVARTFGRHSKIWHVECPAVCLTCEMLQRLMPRLLEMMIVSKQDRQAGQSTPQ